MSRYQQKQVDLFLNEYVLFQVIGEKADEMIKAQEESPKRHSKGRARKDTKQSQDQITEYLTSISKLEKIDRPNSLLFKARMQAYLVENIDTTEHFGRAFEELLEEFPSFIDGYIHFWKYLKHRLCQLTGRSSSAHHGKHASQIKDMSGQKLLEKMREISETALVQSDCTEVPTSLWVEARTIYAKQMIFEKDVGEAIAILKDICYIIPPYQIAGLSYVQELTEEEEDALRDNNFDDVFDPSDSILSPKGGRRGSKEHSKMFSKKLFDKSKATQPRSQELAKGRLVFGKNDPIHAAEQGKPAAQNPRSQQFPKGKLEFGKAGDNIEEEKTLMDGLPTMIETQDPLDLPRAGESQVAGLDAIAEEDGDESERSTLVQLRRRASKNHVDDAMTMLDKIKNLSTEREGWGRHKTIVSVGGAAGNKLNRSQGNRQSMYRAPSVSKSRDKSLTIYNPFAFTRESMNAASF